MSSDTLDRYKVPVFAITCACLISLLAFGPRSAMGFFQLPILQARETLGAETPGATQRRYRALGVNPGRILDQYRPHHDLKGLIRRPPGLGPVMSQQG